MIIIFDARRQQREVRILTCSLLFYGGLHPPYKLFSPMMK